MEIDNHFEEDLALASSLLLDGTTMHEDDGFNNLSLDPAEPLAGPGEGEPWWAMLPQIMSSPFAPLAAPAQLPVGAGATAASSHGC